MESVLSVEPTASFQVQAVSVIESDAFLFQQVRWRMSPPLRDRLWEGHLAFGVDDAMPRDPDCRIEALNDAANEAGPPRHPGHGGDLAIGCNPAQRDAADDGANSFDGCIALEWGRPMQVALRSRP